MVNDLLQCGSKRRVLGKYPFLLGDEEEEEPLDEFEELRLGMREWLDGNEEVYERQLAVGKAAAWRVLSDEMTDEVFDGNEGKAVEEPAVVEKVAHDAACDERKRSCPSEKRSRETERDPSTSSQRSDECAMRAVWEASCYESAEEQDLVVSLCSGLSPSPAEQPRRRLGGATSTPNKQIEDALPTSDLVPMELAPSRPYEPFAGNEMPGRPSTAASSEKRRRNWNTEQCEDSFLSGMDFNFGEDRVTSIELDSPRSSFDGELEPVEAQVFPICPETRFF
jgi:hypothetical protein